MDIKEYINQVGQQARQAAFLIGKSETRIRNQALLAMAEALDQQRESLLKANRQDLETGELKGLDAALLERLTLNPARINAMITGLHQVAALPDPVGEISELHYQPSGIQVGRMRVPLGVIGIIYESRPNVTIEAASLCLKSGNACILRGGSESLNSNQAIAACITHGLRQAGLPDAAVQVIATTDRDAVGHLLQMPNYIDVIIPRGGRQLIERIYNESRIPVIKHLDGVCHVFIDDEADPVKAVRIAVNAKTQRYGTCNTMETLLVARNIAPKILPDLATALREKQVELRGCAETRGFLPDVICATEADWYAEYLAPILSIRVVAGLDEAITHINHYGSAHTDAIVTENYSKARRFLREVDSSSVMVNASTRFADGFEYGLGAEIGISTDKLHARGPVGLIGLTTQKFIVFGDGHIRT